MATITLSTRQSMQMLLLTLVRIYSRFTRQSMQMLLLTLVRIYSRFTRQSMQMLLLTLVRIYSRFTRQSMQMLLLTLVRIYSSYEAYNWLLNFTVSLCFIILPEYSMIIVHRDTLIVICMGSGTYFCSINPQIFNLLDLGKVCDGDTIIAERPPYIPLRNRFSFENFFSAPHL